MDKEAQRLFGVYCPYTGKLCPTITTECKSCEVEQEERKSLFEDTYDD